MIAFFSPVHTLHAPAHEFFRGDRVPCDEAPERAAFVLDAVRQRGHELREPDHDAARVLRRVHSPRYLTFLESAWEQWLALDAANAERQPFPSVWPVRSLRSDLEPENFVARLGLYSMDNGTPMSAGTWTAAKAGADAAVSAASLLRTGTRAAFCATRPPGHHAGADFMGGYCFLNNAAIAAQAMRDGGCERIAVLDVDDHHGNGTQSLFYERDDVLVVSLHGDPRTEYPFYLGHADETGAGHGLGHNLNLPLPAGTTAERWCDPVHHACRQLFVLQQHQMHVQQGRQLVRRVLGHVFLQALQLIDHRIAGHAQTLDLGIDLIGFHKIVPQIDATGGQQNGTPDGDATRQCQAMDAEGHGLFAFAKLVVDQGQSRRQGLFLALAHGLDHHLAAQTSGQHHHAHDAFGIDASLAFAHPDFARKAARQFGQFGRSAGVQPQFIADDHGGQGHVCVRSGFGGRYCPRGSRPGCHQHGRVQPRPLSFHDDNKRCAAAWAN